MKSSVASMNLPIFSSGGSEAGPSTSKMRISPTSRDVITPNSATAYEFKYQSEEDNQLGIEAPLSNEKLDNEEKKEKSVRGAFRSGSICSFRNICESSCFIVLSMGILVEFVNFEVSILLNIEIKARNFFVFLRILHIHCC